MCLFASGLQIPIAVKPVENKKEDRIIGDWISLDKNVIVTISKDGNKFRARLVWFTDKDIVINPMESRLDINNPDRNLRNRKLLGLEILNGLNFNQKSDRWEDGKIYDPDSGREWSSVLTFSDEGLLHVKGYWHFEFLSKSMTFKKMN